MIKKEHYTKNGRHPEDAIFEEKTYINKVQKHLEEVFDRLCADLNLTAAGRDWLFEYVFNEGDIASFEEYVEARDAGYDLLVDTD